MSMLTSNSGGNMVLLQKRGYFRRFHAASIKENIVWVWVIGSGKGLVPSGNKPLPAPILIRICVAISVMLLYAALMIEYS